MIRINLLRDPSSQPAKAPAVKDEPKAASKAVSKAASKSASKEVNNMSESTGKSLPVGGILIALVFASFGGLYYYWLKGNVDAEEERNDTLQAEKKELEPFFKLEEQFRIQKESLKKKEDSLTKLKKMQQLPVQFFNELSNSLPDNIGMLRLATKGQKIEIRGESPSDESIYQFENNLKARPQWFSNVFVGTSTRKGNVFEFGITFDLANP